MVTGTGALNPVEAFAIVGLAGGAQWLAWRFKHAGHRADAGRRVDPLLARHRHFIPERDIGELQHPMISLAVAVILFEGGLTLNFHLADARPAVRRLVVWGRRWAGCSRRWRRIGSPGWAGRPRSSLAAS